MSWLDHDTAATREELVLAFHCLRVAHKLSPEDIAARYASGNAEAVHHLAQQGRRVCEEWSHELFVAEAWRIWVEVWGQVDRDEYMFCMYWVHGYQMKMLAEAFGLSLSRVPQIIHRYERKLEKRSRGLKRDRSFDLWAKKYFQPKTPEVSWSEAAEPFSADVWTPVAVQIETDAGYSDFRILS